MYSLIAAHGVKDILGTGVQVDRGDMALIIAVVAGVAAVRNVQIASGSLGMQPAI